MSSEFKVDGLPGVAGLCERLLVVSGQLLVFSNQLLVISFQ